MRDVKLRVHSFFRENVIDIAKAGLRIDLGGSQVTTVLQLGILIASVQQPASDARLPPQ